MVLSNHCVVTMGTCEGLMVAAGSWTLFWRTLEERQWLWVRCLNRLDLLKMWFRLAVYQFG